MKADVSPDDFLRGVSMFAGLPPQRRDDITARATPVHVAAGNWLFREGDPGDSLYVLQSGRLEVVAEARGGEVIRTLPRGTVVGELALLTNSTRSASVRARRDSDLLKIGRDDFVEQLTAQPEFAFGLAQALGSQLQRSEAIPSSSAPSTTTIVVAPLERGLPVQEVSDRLLMNLRSWAKVTRLLGSEVNGRTNEHPSIAYGQLLDDCERENDQVLLVADVLANDDEWSSFCLRQADRIIALTRGGSVPTSVEGHEELRGSLLVFCGTETKPPQLPRWVERIAPSATYLVRSSSDLTATIDAIARRLAGRSIGLVLSGGGARGFAHIGVIEELTDSGVVIDRVGGCSMGAFIGAMFAMGMSPHDMRTRCDREFVRQNPLNDYTVPRVSLVRGRKAKAMLSRTFGRSTIEELNRQFFCVSCDLVTGELVVHRQGPVVDAVAASMSLPGVLAPIARDERLLVDGGVLNNLPVGPMAASNEGPVIAVDVTARFRPPEVEAPDKGQWIFRTRGQSLRGSMSLPNLKETLVRAIGVGSVDAVMAARQQADLLIAPQTGAVGILEFVALDRMVEAGRQAARAALAGSKLPLS